MKKLSLPLQWGYTYAFKSIKIEITLENILQKKVSF